MANLQLPLKRKWFEMTKSGEKKEDYREITEYWIRRLCISCQNDTNGDTITIRGNTYAFKKFSTNTLTLGYPKAGDSERILMLENKGIVIGTGYREWGAEPNTLYFIIKHGKIL